MCGIAGIVYLDGRPVDADVLTRMADAMRHRGPDGWGTHLDSNVGLAHRRLAIIDPALGVQPFLSGPRALTYNGEIYNYLEVKAELTGSEFHTNSDTEVLMRAYEARGIECLQAFRGMFAFALLDRPKQRLFLVRDRLGIKPLHIYRDGATLAFASELSALRTLPGFDGTISPSAVGSYFRYQYVPAPDTIYRNVTKLPPASVLTVELDTGRVSERRYWSLPIAPSARPEAELLEELNALLDDTLKIYVRSDVPFGAFLSGGVDSSLVSAVMSKHLSAPLNTYTIGFEEEAHSELPYAREAASIVGSVHHQRVVRGQGLEELLARLTQSFGEPFGDSSAVPTYHVSRAAADDVKMVLSGDGGDELFGGYNSYQALYRELSRDPTGVGGAIRGLGRRRIPGRLLERLATLAPALRERLPLGLQKLAYRWHNQRLQGFHGQFREAFDDAGLEAFLLPSARPGQAPEISGVEMDDDVDPLSWFQAHDLKTYMVDDVLTKVDRASMACSLEVRVPLLDHKVVEFAFRLPRHLRLRELGDGSLETKALLKRSAERYFPAPFLARRKQGFGIPIVEWVRGPLRPAIEGALRDPKSPMFQWVRFESMRTMLDEFYAGQDAHVARIWYAMMFERWSKA
ncbi:MAG: asparagine synthase (glutamine-hydrolyzing) [Myxococcota bacterium]